MRTISLFGFLTSLTLLLIPFFGYQQVLLVVMVLHVGFVIALAQNEDARQFSLARTRLAMSCEMCMFVFAGGTITAALNESNIYTTAFTLLYAATWYALVQFSPPFVKYFDPGMFDQIGGDD